MKPYLHAQVSVRKFGGKPEDYQKIHDWFDQSKAHFPDMRHRAILHSSFGIYLAEQMFGINIENSDGKKVSVRDIGEQHVLDDLGTIPTVQDYLSGMPFYNWLGGKKREKKTMHLDDLVPKEPSKKLETTKPKSTSEMVFDGSRPFVEMTKTKPQLPPGHLTQEEIDALLMGTDEPRKPEQLELNFPSEEPMMDIDPMEGLEQTFDGNEPQFDDAGNAHRLLD